MTIPRINRANKMSTDRPVRGRGCPGHTVENPADETPGEVDLLAKVFALCDIWGIGIIRPRDLLRVGHGPDVYGEGGIKLGVGVPR